LGDRSLDALRQAVAVSPDNLPLRRLLAESLMSTGHYDEAEAEFRQALAREPDDIDLKFGLAQAFSQQGKTTYALLVLEEVVKLPKAPGRVFVYLSRLLARSGQIAEAVGQYKRGVEVDPHAADAELAAQLGIRPGTPKEEADDPYTPYNDDTDEIVEGRLRASWEGSAAAPDLEIERPAMRFDDVGGMEELKEEIRMKIIHPMEHPDLYRAYGKAIGGGILLYGPPGCGKTHLARATAGEIRAGFLSVGINDVLEMWIGNSERNLHAIFEQARQNRPCVLFFDEVDALAASRADLRASGGRQLINQFLSELDGIQGNNDGLLILAATNAPWHLDPAFRRPGRFDRILFVPPPDAPARAAILRVLCKGKPVHELDYDQLAKKTEHFSGADLKAVIDQAIESKLREAMKSGVPKPLITKDLTAAAASVKSTTREWFSTAKNYALYANQGGTYDEILKYLNVRLR
jgi:ATP-dependent 26S proteasome regulatory subunit